MNVASFVTKLRSYAFSLKLVAKLVPLNGLSHSTTHGYWESTSDTPSFLISNFSNIQPGWYMVELLMNSENNRLISKFYFDYGDGFEENNHSVLKARSGRLSKRLIFISAGLQSLRYDPMETEGQFSIELLRFIRVSESFAKKRMIEKLKNNNLLNTFSLAKKGSAVKLYPFYNDMFIEGGADSTEQAYTKYLKNEHYYFDDESTIQALIKLLPTPIKFTFLLRVNGARSNFLREAIESVLAQEYILWDMFISYEEYESAETVAVVQEYINKDQRIKIIDNAQQLNSSSEVFDVNASSKDFFVFIDQEDILSSFALYEMVKIISVNANAKCIYSDDDKIDLLGDRFCPHFKTGWNLDLLFSHNYISHLCAIEKQQVISTASIQSYFSGSSYYGLILRATHQLALGNVFHISRVLYHKRVESKVMSLRKPLADEVEKEDIEVLSEFLSQQYKEQSTIVSKSRLSGVYQIDWGLRSQDMVSIIIPTRDKVDLLSQCVESIFQKTSYQNYEIIIVDNNSEEEATHNYFAFVSANEKVRVLTYPKAFNYSAINNFAVKHAKGEYLCLMNNDIQVLSDDWLTLMLSNAQRDDIGCVGVKLLYPNETVQHAGIVIQDDGLPKSVFQFYPKDAKGYHGRLMMNQNYHAVTGACIMVSNELFDKVGGLDESAFVIAYNDIDFCLRVYQRGYRNLWLANVEMFHFESATRGGEYSEKNQPQLINEVQTFKKRWKRKIRGADFLNPNHDPNFKLKV